MNDNAWTVVWVDGVVLRAPVVGPGVAEWLLDVATKISRMVAEGVCDLAVFGTWAIGNG